MREQLTVGIDINVDGHVVGHVRDDVPILLPRYHSVAFTKTVHPSVDEVTLMKKNACSVFENWRGQDVPKMRPSVVQADTR